MAPKKSLEQVYQKKTQLEHVLHRPTMYIGDIDNVRTERWIFSEGKMIRKFLTFNPGLYKIFDEILTNATDHSQRDLLMKKIEITINADEIIIFNDGEAIPIEIHKEHGRYIPEIIFGEFNTSSNYDDTEARIVGGTNGLGAKLTNIFSKKFTVEICDGKNHYIQTWENNMSIKSEPKIKASKKKSFTKISFIPDYIRFNTIGLDDTLLLLKTRVYEACAITDKRVSVFFNEEKLNIKSFEDYISFFIGKVTKTSNAASISLFSTTTCLTV